MPTKRNVEILVYLRVYLLISNLLQAIPLLLLGESNRELGSPVLFDSIRFSVLLESVILGLKIRKIYTKI